MKKNKPNIPKVEDGKYVYIVSFKEKKDKRIIEEVNGVIIREYSNIESMSVELKVADAEKLRKHPLIKRVTKNKIFTELE